MTDALCPSRIRSLIYLLWRFPGLPGETARLPLCSSPLERPAVAALESQRLAVQCPVASADSVPPDGGVIGGGSELQSFPLPH